MIEGGANSGINELVAQELIRAPSKGRLASRRGRWLVMAIVMAIDERFGPAHVKTSLLDAGGMLTEYRPRSSFAALTYD
jgi:hypothetical protein